MHLIGNLETFPPDFTELFVKKTTTCYYQEYINNCNYTTTVKHTQDTFLQPSPSSLQQSQYLSSAPVQFLH